MANKQISEAVDALKAGLLAKFDAVNDRLETEAKRHALKFGKKPLDQSLDAAGLTAVAREYAAENHDDEAVVDAVIAEAVAEYVKKNKKGE